MEGARFCAKCGALLPAAPSEADPLLGSLVGGRFRVVSVLGEGGMGRVYTAEQQMGTHTRRVAVKTLLAEHARDPQVIARFMRECGTVSELEHPNTIKVYDFGQTSGGDLYIAMELLAGCSLEGALEAGGPMPPDRVDRIIGQIVGSLQEAHDKGIVHRDLKPANIHLTARGAQEDFVKVLDFGIAKKEERNPSKAEQKITQQGTVLGTPPYMSPEQFKGGPVDHRSDVYSLAIVTYEMLTGRLPFEAESPWRWATEHMTAQPYPFEATPIGSNVPPKMRAAVMRALEKEPARRPQSATEFHQQLTLGAVLPRYSMVASSALPPSLSAPVETQRPGGTIKMPGAGGPVAGTLVDAHLPPIPALPPPPPARPARESGGGLGPFIAVAAIALVGGGVGGYFAFFRDKGVSTASAEERSSAKVAATVTVTADSQASAPASSPAPAPTPTQQAPAPPPKAQPVTLGAVATATAAPPPPAPPPPPPEPKGWDASPCTQSQAQAAKGDVAGAVASYRKCNGLGKGAALDAINKAALANVRTKGCNARADAQAAASLGRVAAMDALRNMCGY